MGKKVFKEVSNGNINKATIKTNLEQQDAVVTDKSETKQVENSDKPDFYAKITESSTALVQYINFSKVYKEKLETHMQKLNSLSSGMHLDASHIQEEPVDSENDMECCQPVLEPNIATVDLEKTVVSQINVANPMEMVLMDSSNNSQ